MSGGDASASAASLAAIKARQAKWMRERQAELDREGVMAELEHAADMLKPAPSAGCRVGTTGGVGGEASSGGGGGGAGGGGDREGGYVAQGSGQDFKPEQVIDRLTERITDRLRDELRLELQREQEDISKNAAAMGRHVEGVLASEIASHTCPICYDLMMPPEQSPTMLFPCGHTFCAQCLKSHVDKHGKKMCPYCRQDIAAQALNMSLQQIIQNFVAARDKIPQIRNGKLIMPAGTKSEGGVEAGSGEGSEEHEAEELAPGEMEIMYTQRLRTVSVRCEILRNELADMEEESRKIQENASTAQTVLGHLKGEENTLKGRLQGIMRELEVVREQVEEQERRVADVAAAEEDNWRRRELLGKTLKPVEEEMRKLSVLLKRVAPNVTATLM